MVSPIPRTADANKDTAMRELFDIIYPTYLEPIKHKELKLLEIGILKGDSLRVWRDYLINSLVVGLDIDPLCKFTEDRISTFIGNQTNPDVLKTLPVPFDIVIDDASHVCKDQILTFELLFPHLNPGGLYFIEDVRLARKENWNVADTLTPYFTNIARDVSTNRNLAVQYIHFWRNTIVVGKT
jgi:hypothetical protein